MASVFLHWDRVMQLISGALPHMIFNLEGINTRNTAVTFTKYQLFRSSHHAESKLKVLGLGWNFQKYEMTYC